jgi:4-amino-4-deoxy-L-arabinose transferase-like glycosyltransferase
MGVKYPRKMGAMYGLPPHRRPRRGLLCTLCALIASLFFFLAGCVCLPHLGVENDEALFGMAIFKPIYSYSLHIGDYQVPLMVMSYVGALKAWIYAPIFGVFGVGVWALRLPALLAGTASVWLFFLLLRRMAGARAALIGCSLLAVDSTYLLTACFDWGPVALQHLLTVGGLLLLVRFYQQRGSRALAGGFFLLGLALWDKALAVWMLSGIGVAAMVFFPRQILAAITKRRLAISVLAISLGALPLIVYNAETGWPTFSGNFQRDTSEIAGKFRFLTYTARGQALLGGMFYEDSQTPTPHPPQGLLESASARVSALAGHPRQNLFLWAFLLAVLLAPLARGPALRTILFAVVAMAVAWSQMAITAHAGGGAHHTILLWPFPQLVVAVSFAAASRRLGRAAIPAIAIVMSALLISGALATNEHYYRMVRNGGTSMWTDAIFKLSGYLKGVPPQHLYCVDWGILDSLRVLNRGTLDLFVGTDPIAKPDPTPEEREQVKLMISDPRGLFLAHTPAFEFFHLNQKLLDFAGQSGYERQMSAIIPDNWGRPVYEVYHFVPSKNSKPKILQDR